MKRIVLMLTALVLCVAMLAGCGKNAEPQNDAEIWNTVIAKCGDHELTNATLSYYFWSGYAAFLNYYDSSSTAILDLYTPLDEQEYGAGMTWEDYFFQNALTAFRQYSAISDLAAGQGFTLSESNQAKLNNLEQELQATATEMGFETVLEYLQANYGAGASVESYRQYMKDYMTVYEYVAKAHNGFNFSAEEIEKYFDENTEAYKEMGIEKDDQKMVAVRYLTLFEYDNPWETSEGEKINSAQEIFDKLMDEWEASDDHSEEAFMKLGENWADYGVLQNYVENMSPNSGNDAQIEEWAFAAERQPGDYYAMASNAGYFLLYFVKTGDNPYWYTQALYDLQYQAFSKDVDERIAAMEFELDTEQITIAQLPDMYEKS